MPASKKDARPEGPADSPRLAGDTPTMRIFALLELIATRDRFVSLQGLVEETGLPKPTVHRMLQHLEGARLLQRERDGRSYGIGSRLRRFAEALLRNDTVHGARHAVLRRLTREVGETCNLTTLSGGEILYLDRVETDAPLRFFLHPGSRVPSHCSASGKLFLAQLSPAQRRRLLGHAQFERHTANTLTGLDAIEREIERVQRDGYALDDEEFIEGLVCIGVLVPRSDGLPSSLSVAIQAPVMRMDARQALEHLPALRRAAEALSAITAEAEPRAARG